MRLIERTRVPCRIHARTPNTGAMGGRARTWDPVGAAVRGSILPDGGGAETGARGDLYANRVRLLVPSDTRVAEGDGVSMNHKMYIVRAISRWCAHLELLCEAQKA